MKLSKNILKYLGFVFAAFSIISAFFQTLTIQSTRIQYSTWGVTLICAFFSLFFFIRFKNYDCGIKPLLKAIKTPLVVQEFVLKHIRTEIELKPIWNISKDIYKEEMVEFSTVKSWWNLHKDGIYVLYHGFDICGFFSIWPIKETAFKEIIDGKRSEQNITDECIETKISNKAVYWYIANIVVNRKYRKTKSVIILIREVIQQWIQENQYEGEIHFCALGFSKDGELLLKRFGFHMYLSSDKAIDHYPIYVSTKTIKEFQNIAKSLK